MNKQISEWINYLNDMKKAKLHKYTEFEKKKNPDILKFGHRGR